MALSYVGGGNNDATGGSDVTLTLPGGIAQNDIVAVCYVDPSSTDVNMSMTTAGYTEEADLFETDTFPINLGAFWKPMGATPDSTAVCNNPSSNSNCAVFHVWSGGDTASLDATTTTATGQNTGQGDPPSITTNTDNAAVLAFSGSAGDASGTGTPSGYSNYFYEENLAGADSAVAMASKVVSPAGAEDPGVFTGFSTATGYCWCAVTMALKPAAAGGTVNEVTVTDGFYLNDPRESTLEALKPDSVQMADFRFNDINKFLVDSLRTDDTRIATLEKIVEAIGVLLDDTDLRQAIRERSASDGIETSDVRTSILETLRALGVEIGDETLSELAKLADVETVLLSDVPNIFRILPRSLADALLLSDERFGILEMLRAEAAQLDDSRTSGLDKLADVETVLLADVSNIFRILPRLLADGIQIDDARFSVVEKAVLDALEIDEADFRKIEKVILDAGVLFSDSALANAGKLFAEIATDGVLLFDERIADVDKRVFETILIADQTVKALERFAVDGVFLFDAATALRMFTQFVTDALVLSDQALKTAELRRVDSILANDSLIKRSIASLIDSLVLTDNAYRAAELTSRDSLFVRDERGELQVLMTLLDKALLDTLAIRVRESVIREDLLLSDDVTATKVTSTFLAALIWALVKHADLLGVVYGTDSLLGERLSTFELFGTERGSVELFATRLISGSLLGEDVSYQRTP